MSYGSELLTIGQLAHRTGLSVRTIRFWSDENVITPSGRSGGGYRLYDGAAVARLELVATLRDLGLDLETVRRVLGRQVSLAEVARLHAEALDAQIRSLQLRRSVLRSVARRESTTEEMRLMHRLASLSIQERQRIVDDFVARAFAGIDPGAPGTHIAESMRRLPVSLPSDPTPEQVDAWVDLADLLADAQFQSRVREMALAGSAEAPAEAPAAPPIDASAVREQAGAALAEGIEPDSAAAGKVVDRLVDPAAARVDLAERLATYTDRRVERYWQLMAIINGWPAAPPTVPAMEWLIAALRAHPDAPGFAQDHVR